MQPTESHPDGQSTDRAAGRLVEVARRWLRFVGHVLVALLWLGVGLYSQFQPVKIVPYTVGLVGTAISLTLAMALLDGHDGSESRSRSVRGVSGNRSESRSRSRAESRSTVDRLLLAGCLAAMVVGTRGVLSAAGGITASQPQFALSAILVGVLVLGALFALVGRWFGPVAAGLAVVGIGVGWLAAPPTVSLVETMVYDSRGLYGPLARGAASWIAPACLLAGLWRASRTVDRLRTLGPTVTGSVGRVTGRRLGRGLWLLTPPSMGFVALLVAWLSADASYSRVIVVAAVPAALLWVALIVGGRLGGLPFRIEPPAAVDWRAWAGPLLAVGGPLAVMAVLLGGFGWPIGTVLAAGVASLVGLCVVGPWLGITDTAEGEDRERLRGGVGTVVDGSMVGIRLFARAAVLLAVVGGITALLGVAGLSTELVAAVVGLTGGSSLLVVLVVGLVCGVLGLTVPTLAGYATAAVVVVPLVRTLTPVAELTAHLLVWYAVVGGWLLAPAVDRRLRELAATVRSR